MGRRGIAYELGSYALALAAFTFGFVHATLHPPPFAPAVKEQDVLRVVTWNVGNGLERDGGGLRGADIEHVARVLRELDPDLVCLQELTGRLQLRQLVRALGPGWNPELSRGASTRRVAVLSRGGSLDTFDVEDAGRRVIGVEYRPGHGPALVAVSIHADAFSSTDRNQELGAAVEALFANDTSSARLLLGDLNLDLDLDKRRDLFTDDAYLDVETYNFVAERLLDAARDSGPTAEPDRRLDYVFVDDAAFEVVDAGAWKDQRAGGMDHDPVIVDLRLRR